MGGALRKKSGSMMRKNGIIGDPRGPATERQKRQLAMKFIAQQLDAHPCGDCIACCTVKQVDALKKPEGVKCEHAIATEDMHPPARGGCKIYSKRPQACRDYFCGYRYGLVGSDEALRPDKLGLVFDVAESPPPGIMMLAVREVYDGAIDDHQRELNQIAARGAVLYLIRGERRFFMGAEEKVKACQEWSRRHLPLVAR